MIAARFPGLAGRSTRAGRPRVLGLFTSVVVTLSYLRRNRVRCELGEHVGASRATISRRVATLTPVLAEVLKDPLPTVDDLDPTVQLVLLELGGRGGTHPAGIHPYTSMVAEHAIGAFGHSVSSWKEFAPFEVLTLARPDGAAALVADIDEHSRAAGFPSEPRPARGYAVRAAFDDSGETADVVSVAYRGAPQLIDGAVPTIGEIREHVRSSAALL